MPHLELQLTKSADRQAQDAVLKKVRGLQGVTSAVRVDPDTDDPVISRMVSVDVTDTDRLAAIKAHLAKLAGIESVEEPAQRGLVW